jgi:hypothetical protein
VAASQEQKVDYLLKKLGYSASKTGIAEDENNLVGTKKAPFAEPIPSPLVVSSTNVWTFADKIPTDPSTADAFYVQPYLASASGLQLTPDNTVADNRTFLCRSVYGNNSSDMLGDWIDTAFGPDYIVEVYKGDPNSGGVKLSAAGSGTNDTWFFDYSSGVLNFNGDAVPSGVTASNVYLVGYRYVGPKGIGDSQITNVFYVTKDGRDANSGRRVADSKATIKSAVSAASTLPGSVVKVFAGTYVENNPIKVGPQVSVVGDSLREVSVIPQNAGSDLFHVSPGDLIRYSGQSPYLLNCTNFITNSIGMKIDGDNVIGPFKSFVTDSFTQYNQNGIGASITNKGYAQIVSLFTINSDVGIFCGSGGQCDVTNSNSSFGNFGLVADGVSPLSFTGIISATSAVNADTFNIFLDTPNLTVNNAVYDNVTGLTTITTNIDHNFSVGMDVSLERLVFSCDSYGNYSHTFSSASNNGVTITGGSQITPTDATYDPLTGVMVVTKASHGLAAASTKTATGATYNPNTGLLTVTSNNHGIGNGTYIKFALNSFRFTCGQDSDATNHDYPRESDPVFNKWIQVSNSQTNTFDVNVGTSENTSVHNFVSATTNGIQVASSSVGFATGAICFTCAQDNYQTPKCYPRTTDPAHNAIIGIDSVTTDTFSVNIGVSTTGKFPDNNGRVFTVKSAPSSKVFTVHVGPNRFEHTYVNGGKTALNIIRPYDGQVVYFDELYNTVDNITITNAGSGYNSTPTVTISSPNEPWGITATAIPTVTNGFVTGIEILSEGRGYTSTPTITFSTPDVGINTATAVVELTPSYYSVKSSTSISSGICTVTFNNNLPYSVGIGTTVPFFKQSRVLASSHSFEYIGSGTDPVSSLPSRGGVAIQENEVDNRNGGLVIYTSTDQGGNFRIGEGVVIDQVTGTISGNFYSKSLFANVTPLILALGGN